MAESRQFANEQRPKRAAKGKRPARESTAAKDKIIVQRMSSAISGNRKVFYMRFIKMLDSEVSNGQDEKEHEQETHKLCDNTYM